MSRPFVCLLAVAVSAVVGPICGLVLNVPPDLYPVFAVCTAAMSAYVIYRTYRA